VIRIHFYRHTVFGICYPQHPPPVFSFSCGLSAKRNAKAATATLWLQVAISCQPIVSDVPRYALSIGYDNRYDNLSVITSNIGRKMSSSSVDGAFGAEIYTTNPAKSYNPP
jgi:hypothetical protein